MRLESLEADGVDYQALRSAAIRILTVWRSQASPSGAVVAPEGELCYMQPGNLKLAMRVLQLKLPLAFRYSVVYQNVQSSLGSTVIWE